MFSRQQSTACMTVDSHMLFHSYDYVEETDNVLFSEFLEI
jgi:hypothetical protein